MVGKILVACPYFRIILVEQRIADCLRIVESLWRLLRSKMHNKRQSSV